jgi:hypothetical protein
VPFQKEVEGLVERTAGDEVTGSSGLKLGCEDRIVLCRCGGCEDDLDIGKLFIERRNDDVAPDAQVVVAPAVDGELLS